ncbi:MAG TPA: DUF4236 domain-containing protein [Planctomycetes bacterium]|nr:DUF4236 domain-containing protein [Planctomycetota bacterium]
MSFRFWGRIGIAPGVSLNLSKSAGSLSFGPPACAGEPHADRRGAKFTIGPRGKRATVGIDARHPWLTPFGRNLAVASTRPAAIQRPSLLGLGLCGIRYLRFYLISYTRRSARTACGPRYKAHRCGGLRQTGNAGQSPLLGKGFWNRAAGYCFSGPSECKNPRRPREDMEGYRLVWKGLSAAGVLPRRVARTGEGYRANDGPRRDGLKPIPSWHR